MQVNYEFGSGKQTKLLTYEMRIWNPYPYLSQPEGAALFGDKGYIIVGNTQWIAYGERGKELDEEKETVAKCLTFKFHRLHAIASQALLRFGDGGPSRIGSLPCRQHCRSRRQKTDLRCRDRDLCRGCRSQWTSDAKGISKAVVAPEV